jgi:hypothetical protein
MAEEQKGSSAGKVQFRLRTDIPHGYRSNEKYPKLLAAVDFLTRFEGQVFDSAVDFKEKVADAYLTFLETKGISHGEDPLLRTGLLVAKLPERYLAQQWDYEVLTVSNSHAGVCVFGGLELLTEH